MDSFLKEVDPIVAASIRETCNKTRRLYRRVNYQPKKYFQLEFVSGDYRPLIKFIFVEYKYKNGKWHQKIEPKIKEFNLYEDKLEKLSNFQKCQQAISILPQPIAEEILAQFYYTDLKCNCNYDSKGYCNTFFLSYLTKFSEAYRDLNCSFMLLGNKVILMVDGKYELKRRVFKEEDFECSWEKWRDTVLKWSKQCEYGYDYDSDTDEGDYNDSDTDEGDYNDSEDSE